MRVIHGNIFEQNVSAIVNPVNCRGVMGNGLAAKFKVRHPRMFEDYQRACRSGELRPGKIHTWEVAPGRFIINFPTKDAFWNAQRQSIPSRREDIASGLEALVTFVNAHDLRSIALPALGCGQGDLTIEVVQPLIEQAAARMPKTAVSLIFFGQERQTTAAQRRAPIDEGRSM